MVQLQTTSYDKEKRLQEASEWKGKHSKTSPKLTIKEVGVYALFGYYTAACNSPNKNRQKTVGVQQVVTLVGIPLN